MLKHNLLPLLLAAAATAAAAAENWPPRFEKPQVIVHGSGAEVGPIRVPANWPQVQLLDWDQDGHDDLLINQPQHVANLLYRNLNRWHDGAPVFAAPEVIPIGPGAIGSLVGENQLQWIGAVRGKGAYACRVLRRTKTGYEPGKQLPLLEASSGKPLSPPLHNSVEPTLRILDLDGDERQDLVVGIRMTGYGSPLGIQPPGGWGWPTSFSPDGTWLGNDSLGAVVWHRNVGPMDKPLFTIGKPLKVAPARLPLFTYDDAACEVVDLNGDDALDLVVCTFDRLLWFEIQRNDGQPRLSTPRVLEVGGTQRLPYQRLGVLASSLDGDELVDLVLYGPGFLYFAKNTGSETAPRFAPLKEVLQTSPPLAVDGFAVPAAADLSGDGQPDLIVGTEDGYLRYFENTGRLRTAGARDEELRCFQGGSWRDQLADQPVAPLEFKAGVYLEADGQVIRITTPRNLTGPLEELWGYAGPVLSDFDGDGDLDLLSGCVGPFIMFYENMGDSNRHRFASRGKLRLSNDAVLPNGYRVRPAVVDADGDGRPDLLAIDLQGRLTLHLRGRRDKLTVLEPGRPVPDENGKPLLAVGGTGRRNGRTILSVVDWDGDWDLVAGMRAQGERLRYYENIGSSLKPRLKYVGGFPTKRPGGHYQMAEFCDFDGDGVLEVVAGSDHGLIYYFRPASR